MSTPTAPPEEPGTGPPDERPPSTLQRIAPARAPRSG